MASMKLLDYRRDTHCPRGHDCASLACSTRPRAPGSATAAEDRSADRVANWVRLHDFVAGLFARFIDVRLGAEWITKETAAMAVWRQRLLPQVAEAINSGKTPLLSLGGG